VHLRKPKCLCSEAAHKRVRDVRVRIYGTYSAKQKTAGLAARPANASQYGF
jgi:hypothetical protein